MKTWKKTALIISGCLVGVGVICAGIGLANGGSIRYGISLREGYVDYSEAQEKRIIDQLGNFEQVSVHLEGVSLQILPSQSKEAYIETNLGEKRLQWSVEDGTLSIQEFAERKAYGFYGFSVNPPFFGFGTGSVSQEEDVLILYLPDGINLKGGTVDTGYGDLTISQVNCGELTLTVDSGDVSLKEVSSSVLLLEADYGNVSLEEVTVDTLSIRLESGEYDGKNVNAKELTLEADYGNAIWENGSVQTGSIVVESGDATLRQVQVLNQLEVNNEYGDILFESREGADAYSYDLNVGYGEITIGEKSYVGGVLREKEQAPVLNFHAESGDIILK